MTHHRTPTPAIFRIELIPLPGSIGPEIDIGFEAFEFGIYHDTSFPTALPADFSASDFGGQAFKQGP
jgi:hypothetical protein